MFIPTPSPTFVDLDNSPFLTRPVVSTYTPAPDLSVVDRAATRVATNISFQGLSYSEQMRHVIIEAAAEVLDANVKTPSGIGRLRTVDVIKRTLAFVVEYSGGESIAQPVDNQIAVMLCALRDAGVGGNMNFGVKASLNWETDGTWSTRQFCFTYEAIRALNCQEPENTRLDDLPQGTCSSRQ